MFKKTFFLFFLFVIFSSSIVTAIGISPPSIITNFESFKTETFSFTISNTKESDASIMIHGYLSEYATASVQEVHLDNNENKIVSVTITYPSYEKLTTYGKQKLYVKATEISKSTGGIGAVAAVAGTIVINVPIPGEYAEITKFNIQSVEKTQNTNIQLTLENKGTEPLTNKQAEVILYSPTGQQQEKYTFNNINIPVGQSIDLTQEIKSNKYIEGKYTANATFTFSQELEPAKKSTIFFIGSTDIVLDSYTQVLTRGKINKIFLSFQSIWGSPLTNVRSEFNFNGNTENLPVLDFAPFGTTTINAHPDVPIDAQDKMTGELKISIPVANQIQEKIIKLDFQIVDADEIILPEDDTFNYVPILIASVIILILILLSLNIYLLSKTRKKKNEKKK